MAEPFGPSGARVKFQVQKEIQDRLADRALEPQVVVSLIDRRARPVTVLGDVNSSARFSLDPGGERLLGAIARAGGPKFPSYESVVSIQRNGQTRRTLLTDIAMNPRENIQMESGDSIYVARAALLRGAWRHRPLRRHRPDRSPHTVRRLQNFARRRACKGRWLVNSGQRMGARLSPEFARNH